MAIIAPYGSWRSPITATHVTAGQVSLSGPYREGTSTWWCEGRPEEKGRVTLLRRGENGRVVEITPVPFNLRTRIQEYGGRAYAVASGGGAGEADGGEIVVGVRFEDQRLYRLGIGTEPLPLTPESGGALRYGDLAIDIGRRRVLAVREDHREAGEPVTTIVAVALDAAGDDAGRVLVEGADFYAYPRLSPDGTRLAWIAWHHPDMPWDATELWEAPLDRDGALGESVRAAGGPGESVVQPEWLPDGSLLYVSDRSGWWNLWCRRGGETRPVCPMAAEFGGPLWVLGLRWYDLLDERQAVVSWTESGRWQAGRLDLASGTLSSWPLPYAEIGGVSCGGGRAVVIAAAEDGPAAVLEIDPATGGYEVVARSGEVPVGPAWIARPRPMAFPTTDGGTAYALWYPPTNPDFAAPPGERPPLIVRSHGGPTAAASPALRLAYQFWTSRGFALVDVNYRGSTGYGRAYREALNGRWGVADTLDCVAAARALVAEGLADPARLVIAGGSAGGYTTLCALTFHDVFAAGASYYGIGDLEALAKDTHKFESRYLDRLVGPWPAAAELYRARSPIHHVERLSCPVIFFQGEDDKVVPPAQAETMVAALRRKGLPVAHLSFPGESHGFRRAETIQRCLLAEHAFYCRIFGITPAEPLPPLGIANLAP